MSANFSLFSRIFKGDNSVIAFVDGEARTARELKQQMLQLTDFIKTREEKNWLMWADGPYGFLLQFCALCLANKKIILPGNCQLGSIERIVDEFDAVISESAIAWNSSSKASFTLGDMLSGSTVNNTNEQHISDLGNSTIVLYTSGSTGEPKPVIKTLSLLAKEVIAQDTAWGKSVGNKSVISTVSHQHIYGMLHYVLWPLYRGAPFIEPLSHLPEEVFQAAGKYKPCVLVSSPTHLKRLPDHFNASEQGVRFDTVFSSTGLLQEHDAMRMLAISGKTPIEIFGSTETGGVAWRQRLKGDTGAWRPLSGVSVERNQATGCLILRSAYMAESSYEMSDCIDEVEGTGFILKGRRDQVVKVEGKRLSVTEMELMLAGHPWVEKAKILVIKAKREEVGAVVVLNNKGVAYMQENTRLALNTTLKHSLSLHFEMPLLPRKWRYVDDFPRNSQGKATHELLKKQFT